MPFKKGQPRPANAGRKKGTANRATAEVKAALVETFDRLGGVDFLATWAKDNPGEFLKLWVKLLPTEVRNADGEPFKVARVTEVVVRTREEAKAFLARTTIARE